MNKFSTIHTIKHSLFSYSWECVDPKYPYKSQKKFWFRSSALNHGLQWLSWMKLGEPLFMERVCELLADLSVDHWWN